MEVKVHDRFLPNDAKHIRQTVFIAEQGYKSYGEVEYEQGCPTYG